MAVLLTLISSDVITAGKKKKKNPRLEEWREQRSQTGPKDRSLPEQNEGGQIWMETECEDQAEGRNQSQK